MNSEFLKEQPHAPYCKVDRLNSSPRCGAKRKYDGSPCQAPAANGKGRCRMHGGAKMSGAPRKNVNALKNGFYSEAQRAFRKLAKYSCSV